jgi:Flp pilus assembly protein TadG
MTSKAPSGINVFVHEKRCNVAVLFALMMIPVVGAIGAAVDYARMLRLKTQLQTVADAATMAGLKTYRETGDAEEGRQRLLAFIDEGLEKDGMTRARKADEEGADLMGGTRRQGRIVVVSDAVINTENSTVKPVLATTIETPFMSFLGVEQLPVEVYTGVAVAASSITGTKAIEVSVMLDVSGSMGGDKIDDMNLAAGDFIDIILPDGVEMDNRRIGLVPFSQYVNAGSYASAATGLAPTLQVETGTQTTGVVFSAAEFDWLSLNQCRNRVRDTTKFGNYSSNEARQ